MRATKLLLITLCICLVGILATPAFAGDRDVGVQDLKGIPKKHRFLTTVVGGAALGAGIGAIMPGGMHSVWKGMLIGGGGSGKIYLVKHRNAAGGWTDWANIASTAALGTGLGWTVCGCSDGAFGGLLVGGGLEAIWQASKRPPTRR